MRALEPALAIYSLFSAFALGIRLFFRWKSRDARAEKRSGFWWDGVLAWSAFAAMFVVPVVNFSSPILRFADVDVPAAAVWAGCGVLGLAIWLFARAHADLGRNWSTDVRIRHGHELVTSGVYSHVRHPMYGALALAAVGFVPVLHNWAVSFAMLAVSALFLTVRARYEERLLAGYFGDPYRAYVARTGRVLPRMRSRAQEDAWPPIPGKYFVANPQAPVAVTALGSVGLAQAVAKAAPRGLCIAGKLETENIGIEKIVKNVVANPAIRFLVCAGIDVPKHLSGATLLALCANGTDALGRIAGSPGRRPVLRNTSAEEVRAFRSQIEPIDMIGCTDAAAIGARVCELAARATEAAKPAAGASGPAARNVPRIAASAPPPERIKLDQAGYFVIDAQNDTIFVEHYDYQERLLRSVEGSDARTIYWTLIGNGWVTKLDHAAYLGKELARAESCMKSGADFVQDGA